MKKIAIIGASYLQLPLVLKAKEMNLEVHCFAWEEGAVCKEYVDYFYPISIVEKEEILSICKEVKIDAICSIASDVAVPTICYVAEQMGLIGNSFDSSLKSTDKYQMRQVLSENKVSCPKYFKSTEKNQFHLLEFPVVVKPTDRSGSLGVEKVGQIEDLASALSFAEEQSFTKNAIVEEFIDGSEVSVESISWNGNHYILAITDKVITSPPYFVELAHHQPSSLPSDIQETIREETLKALDALEIKYGASHAEFKITKEGKVFAMEIGARMGGDFIGSDLVYLSTGYDFLKGVIDVSLGNFNEPAILHNKNSGVFFLSKETEHIKEYISQEDKPHWIVKSEITNQEVVPVKKSADRSGYLIYQANDRIELF